MRATGPLSGYTMDGGPLEMANYKGKDGLVAAVNCRGPLLEKELCRLLRGADPGTTDLGAISP